ncbi:hypothetical protein CSKR_101478 [Clonorchis sinensis]|uniref:Uncharacterized protein n=1 Tax=Clonorchis sinensis TaxID=79923 RepID=A0A3R7F8R0_CLOSI|nr:hypothetical protein CSKR_101478 [Clonorchis sinensis]
MAQWLERERTDRKVHGSTPTAASRLALSRLGQPGIIPALIYKVDLAVHIINVLTICHPTETSAEYSHVAFLIMNCKLSTNLDSKGDSSQAQVGSQRPHPERRTVPITPKLSIISFMPFCQVLRCPHRCACHPGGAVGRNTRFSRRYFNKHGTC